ncbi:MAG: cellulase family glycosylhydrolase [Bacteroidia bacterium]|nr:cellulase family glycosylhydrolase [Bacteroidia bacterium]
MKKVYVVCGLMAALSMAPAFGQEETMYVTGNTLYDVCGNAVVMQGVNHAPYNWGWSPAYNVFPEIEKTGSNTVRIAWYTSQASGGGAPAYADLSLLDSAITRCAAAKMIPVLELHDHTCMNDSAQFISMVSFFTQPAVQQIVHKHRSYLVLNLANEALHVMWGGTVQRYVNIYTKAIGMVRDADIHVPLMIDAPDCGQHLDVFQQAGQQLKDADPDDNIIFSAHAYWSAYANNMDSVSVRAKLQAAVNTGFCYVLGEVANRQSDGNDECAYTLNYGPLLRIAREMQIGYLVWSWDNDVCAPRAMSSNGMFSQLTPYGSDMVNNAGYGLLLSERSPWLAAGMECAPGTGLAEHEMAQYFTVSKNSDRLYVHSSYKGDASLQLLSMDGKVLYNGRMAAFSELSVQDTWTGIKIVKIQTSEGMYIRKIF